MTPFVIVSHLRSGTHLLRTSLESHPEIRCQSEVFNANSRELPYPLSTTVEAILDRYVWGPEAAQVEAAGFVLHSYHPLGLRAFPGLRENPGWAGIWARLAAMPELRVVHLWREDLLARHVSQLTASQRVHWHAWDPARVDQVTHLHAPPKAGLGPQAPAEPVRVDLDQLRTDIVEILELRARVRARLAHLALLELSYEELCGAYDATCERALAFLGVSPRPLSPAVFKLQRRPLRELVENYEPAVELARALTRETRR